MSEWFKICLVTEIPVLGARVVQIDGHDDIAVFRTENDKVFALTDKCPHKGGPLSQGIVYGENVACPLHNWHIQLETGEACKPDEGCTGKHPVKVEGGMVYLKSPLSR